MIRPLSSLDEFGVAIATATADRRGEMTRQVTTLFLAGSDEFTDQQVELFDRVLALFIDKIETRALVELGERLASNRRAPIGVMKHLARHDEISVAGPVLARSERIPEADLIAV